jgi:hypothetical protein
MDPAPRHRCSIYEGAPSMQLRRIADVAAERLAANYRCLYLNSPAMAAEFRAALLAAGIDAADAVARGTLVLSSDREHLVDGVFDIERMLASFKVAVKHALADGYAGLWGCGDVLWEFESRRNLSKLLAYEVELEELVEGEPALCGICQYHRDTLPADSVQVALFTHRAIHLNETLHYLNPYYRQLTTLYSAPNGCDTRVRAMLHHLRD